MRPIVLRNGAWTGVPSSSLQNLQAASSILTVLLSLPSRSLVSSNFCSFRNSFTCLCLLIFATILWMCYVSIPWWSFWFIIWRCQRMSQTRQITSTKLVWTECLLPHFSSRTCHWEILFHLFLSIICPSILLVNLFCESCIFLGNLKMDVGGL